MTIVDGADYLTIGSMQDFLRSSVRGRWCFSDGPRLLASDELACGSGAKGARVSRRRLSTASSGGARPNDGAVLPTS